MAAPTPDAGPELIGRAPLVAAILETLHEGDWALVTGETGIGKTAALRAVAASAQGRLHVGQGLAMLSDVPLVPLRRAIRRSLPLDDPPAAAAAVVADVVRDGLLVIDDLQWADQGTITLLGLLRGRVRTATALSTDDLRSEEYRAAALAAGASEHPVAPLGTAEARALVAAIRPDLDRVDAELVVRRSGGNPMILGELAAGGEPSGSLRSALLRRLAGLSDEARFALALLHVAGRPIPAELVGAAAAELLAARVARRRRDHVGSTHVLLAELAAESLDEQGQRRTHEIVARAAVDASEASRHLLAAGQPAEAARIARAGARRASDPAEKLRLLAVAGRSDPSRASPHEHGAAAVLRARDCWARGDIDGALREASAVPLDSVDPAVATALAVEDRRARLLGHWERAPVHDVTPGIARDALGLAAAVVDGKAGPADAASLAAAARNGAADELELLAVTAQVLLTGLTAGAPNAARLARGGATRAQALGRTTWVAHFRALSALAELHAAGPGPAGERLRPLEQLAAPPVEHRMGLVLQAHLALGRVDAGAGTSATEPLRAFASAPAGRAERAVLAWVDSEASWLAGRSVRPASGPPEWTGDALPPVSASLLAITTGWTLPASDRWEAPATAPLSGAGPAAELAALHLWRAGENEGDVAAGFEGAARAWERHHERGVVRCLWAAGEACRRGADRGPARRLLLEAEERAVDAGLVALLGRIRQGLRRAGVERADARSSRPALVTARQREILVLVGEGLTSAAIAAALGISAETVNDQVKKAIVRTGARNRLHAASLVMAAAPS